MFKAVSIAASPLLPLLKTFSVSASMRHCGWKAGGFLYLSGLAEWAQADAMDPEQHQWESSPSQWLNLWHYLIALVMAGGAVAAGIFMPPLFGLLAIPFVYALWRYLIIRCTRYILTSQRLRIRTGVLNQNLEEIELYRVKDMNLARIWWMRLAGLTRIDLQTSDRSMPNVRFEAIRDGERVRELLRSRVEHMRDRKRVREMDFDNVGSSSGEFGEGDGDFSGGDFDAS